MPKRLKFFVLCFFILIFFFFGLIRGFPDGKLHLVFCDVGQGDAVYIKGPKGSDVLIDGGPNERVLNCLGQKMSFWDRTIELVILSHPQADHLVGLIEVLKRYRVLQIIDSSAKYDSQIAKAWEKLIEEKKINTIAAAAGQRITVDKKVNLEIIWPPENFKTDVNELSTVVFLSFGRFSGLFTGDIGLDTMDILSRTFPDLPDFPDRLTLVKVPHHGSKNSLSEKFYEFFRPQLGVISVGKNSYGHPAPEVLNFLNSLSVEILRTDQNGTIEIQSDGQTWFLPSPNLTN